jgi:DNA helicase-2/ATP-dependent DNA helicase PcrA
MEDLNYLLKVRYSSIPLFSRIENISEVIANYNDGGKNKKKYIKTLLSLLNIKKDYKEIYRNLFTSEIFRNKFGDIDTSFIDKKILNYEDSLLFIYLKGLLDGFPYNGLMKQVVIDEAQDYTPLQYLILRKIFNNASFTILGDVNQTINPYYKYNNLNILEDIFNNKTICLELTKTYRSSKEIIEYTNGILNLNYASAIRKNNNIPVVLRKEVNIKEQLISDVNHLKNEYKSLAIITKNDIEADKIYSILKDEFNINILNSNSDKFNRDLVIVPSYVSKGLEFDSVIIYTDIDNKYTPEEKYLYYVACTRCQHELIIYNN